MPYESAKQRRYMWSQHPDIASRWSAEGHGYVKRKKRVSKARIPKAFTRKRALAIGAGGGGGLIAYRELPKLLKPPMGYEQQGVYKKMSTGSKVVGGLIGAHLLTDIALVGAGAAGGAAAQRHRDKKRKVAKGLSRSAIESLMAEQAMGMDRHATPEQKRRGQYATDRLERHTTGRGIARATARRWAGKPEDFDFEDAGRRLAPAMHRERQFMDDVHLKLPGIPATTGGMLNEEIRQRFPELQVKQQQIRAKGIADDRKAYSRAGHRRTPEGRQALFEHHLDLQGRNDPNYYPLRPRYSAAAAAHFADQAPWAERPAAPNPPLADGVNSARRIGRGRLTAVAAGAVGVGLTAEGLRRSLRRNKEQGSNAVRKEVRKDTWADEQRYREDQARIQDKRNSGHGKQRAGGFMLGTAGLAGISVPHWEKGRREVHLGSVRKPRYTVASIGNLPGAKVKNISSIPRFRLTASKGALLWTGAGAGLLGWGTAQRAGAHREDRKLRQRLDNKLAAAHAEATEKYVNRGAMPPKTKREAVSYDELVARGKIPPEKQDRKLVQEQRQSAAPIPPAPGYKPMFSR